MVFLVIGIAAIPASYFLTLALAGALIENVVALKVGIPVVVALLVFAAFIA